MTGLAKHNPIWDPTRASLGRPYVHDDRDVLIATDFECGNGHRIRRTAPGTYSLEVEPEPGDHEYGGWGYYFCFGIRSKQPEASIVRVQVLDPAPPGNTPKDIFAKQTGHVVLRRAGVFSHLDPAAIESDPRRNAVWLTLDLPPGSDPDPVLFVSNFHWHPISELKVWLDELALRPGVQVTTYGESHEGRPLWRIDIGPPEPAAPLIVLAQTPQPSEMLGTWACRAVAEFLLSDAPDAERVRSQHHVVLLPATNPDGTVLGLAVSHPLGRFPYFEGERTADGEPDPLPEMAAQWRLLQAERPWLFIEWHGNNWSRRPGHMLLRYRPALMAEGRLRRVWENIDRRLEALPDTHHGNWTSWDEGLYQQSMGFAAITRLGAISYMIKQHDKFPLAASLQHAVACFRAAVAAWDAMPQD